MAAIRCRSCRAMAAGGQLSVLDSHGAWTEWHLCGRCWGFLVLGLRKKLRDACVDPLLNTRALELRPRQVRAAIREGLRVVAVREPAVAQRSQRDELVAEERRVVSDLSRLLQEVESSLGRRLPEDAWRDLRARIVQLRAQVRELRERQVSFQAARAMGA